MKSLISTRSLAARLQGAIERRDSRLVARLLLRFRRVTSGRGEPQAFRGRALRAYNKRYLAISRAAGAVQRERSRLERSL